MHETGCSGLVHWDDKVTLVHSNFCEIKQVLDDLDINGVDGILLDLGVSSPQLDEAARGFSYLQDAPLDMRMDRRQSLTAKDIVNGYSEMDLYRIIRDYGEDQFAKNIAKHIVRMRQEKPLETGYVSIICLYLKTLEIKASAEKL